MFENKKALMWCELGLQAFFDVNVPKEVQRSALKLTSKELRDRFHFSNVVLFIHIENCPKKRSPLSFLEIIVC